MADGVRPPPGALLATLGVIIAMAELARLARGPGKLRRRVVTVEPVQRPSQAAVVERV